MSDLAILMTAEGLDCTPDGDWDGSLQTAVNLSLFGPVDWWGDAYATDAEALSSKLGPLLDEAPPLTNAVRLKAEDAARADLAWLLTVGASSLAVTATIPDVGILGLTIDIVGPSGDPLRLRYGINWQTQEVTLWQ